MNNTTKTLLVTLACSGSFALGVISHRRQVFPVPQLARVLRDLVRKSSEYQSGSDDLQGSGISALGYASSYESASGSSGVLRAISESMEPGLTLVCSSHDSVVSALDARGSTVFTWDVDPERIWPEYSQEQEDPWRSKWHRSQLDLPPRTAQVTDDGGLIVIVEYLGIARLAKDSTVIWAISQSVHHDFEVQPDGTVVCIAARNTPSSEFQSRFGGGLRLDGIWEDHVLVISPEGEVIREVSILQSLLRSPYAAYALSSLAHINSWDRVRTSHFPVFQPPAIPEGFVDFTHANSIRRTTPEFLASQDSIGTDSWIISLREPSLIVAMSVVSGEITWADAGQWLFQHQATPLPSGKLLIVDNRGGDGLRGLVSRVVSYDPDSRQVGLIFPTGSESFDTAIQGYVEYYDSGNILIVESTHGRVIELDSGGRVVWEYINPHEPLMSPGEVAVISNARRYVP